MSELRLEMALPLSVFWAAAVFNFIRHDVKVIIELLAYFLLDLYNYMCAKIPFLRNELTFDKCPYQLYNNSFKLI